MMKSLGFFPFVQICTDEERRSKLRTVRSAEGRFLRAFDNHG